MGIFALDILIVSAFRRPAFLVEFQNETWFVLIGVRLAHAAFSEGFPVFYFDEIRLHNCLFFLVFFRKYSKNIACALDTFMLLR